MKTKTDIPNIELRSGEVQELMGKIPPAIIRVGISVILIFVILIYIASNYIKYPDIISIPIVAKNVNYVTEIKPIKSGVLIEANYEYGSVDKGYTLAKLVTNSIDMKDTIILTAPFAGVIYPCDTFHENDYIEKNTALCVLVDSIRNKITAKGYISTDYRNRITIGMEVESSINNNSIEGKVTSIANYANPNNGTYTINMEFETPEELNHTIVWNLHIDAKIIVTERSVFDKFFKDKFILSI